MKLLSPEEVEAVYETSRAVVSEAVRLCEEAKRVRRERSGEAAARMKKPVRPPTEPARQG